MPRARGVAPLLVDPRLRCKDVSVGQDTDVRGSLQRVTDGLAHAFTVVRRLGDVKPSPQRNSVTLYRSGYSTGSIVISQVTGSGTPNWHHALPTWYW